MDSNDVLGMSDDAALVVLQSAILNVEEGDDDALQQSLAQHSDSLDGYLAVINDYDAVDDSQMVAMMQTLNLGGQDFELVDTVLQGNDVSSMVASLDLSHLQDVGSEGVLNITSLVTDDDVAGTWGVQNALDVINTAGAASIVAVEALEGIASALGSDGANQLDLEALVTIAGDLNFQEDVDLSGIAGVTLTNVDLQDLDVQDAALDIAGLTNTADLDLLSILPDANLNEILNVPLEDLQIIDSERLPELCGGIRATLIELLPDPQIAYLLSDEGMGAGRFNQGTASFSEIAAGIAGTADAIFEILANNPAILPIDDVQLGATDVFAGL